MKLLLNGETIDLGAPQDLMTHLSKLRSEPCADLRIEKDCGSSLQMLKKDDRAMLRYLPDPGASGFMGVSGSDADDEVIGFRWADGTVEYVALECTLRMSEAYAAVVHFIRSGGMSETLHWQAAA